MSLQLVPYLVMDGNSKEAIEFYEKVFTAENLGIVKFGDMPQNPDFPIPEETKDLIAHATLKVGESILMFSDNFPGQPHQKGNQVTICVSTKDTDKSQQLFEALQVGGQVSMPLQKTDFSPSYGIVTDKFGVTFQIYTESH
ncbi:VOC family protein [Niallia oryzisoli]|uniref:VOC family protein n=1 Tax=Niallia oryzisoli TaxID=1737571 RepID=A0ABZ2C649_9BACI